MVGKRDSKRVRQLWVLLLSLLVVMGLSITFAPGVMADDGENSPAIKSTFGAGGGGSLVNMSATLYVTIQSKADSDLKIKFNQPENVSELDIMEFTHYNKDGDADEGTFTINGQEVTLNKCAKPLTISVFYAYKAGTMDEINKMLDEMVATIDGAEKPFNLAENNNVREYVVKTFNQQIPQNQEQLDENVKAGLRNITVNFDVKTLSKEYVEQLQKNSIKLFNPEGKEIAIDNVLNPNPVAQQTSTSNVTETKDKVNDQKATKDSNPTPKAVNKAPATGDLNGDVLYFVLLLSSILAFSIVFVLKRKSTDNIEL